MYYYPGHWIQYQSCTHSAPSQLPGEHSGQAPLQGRTQSCHIKQQITFASYQVPIHTPGWRAATWIKCLAEGQKCQALTGIEPATLWSRVKGSIQYTTSTSTYNTWLPHRPPSLPRVSHVTLHFAKIIFTCLVRDGLCEGATAAWQGRIQDFQGRGGGRAKIMCEQRGVPHGLMLSHAYKTYFEAFRYKTGYYKIHNQ